MDLETSVIGAVAILLFVIPFALMSIKNSKREKRLREELFALAAKSKCTITRFDVWDNSLIGIDDKAKMLFFISKEKGGDTSKEVNLSQVQQCRVEDHSRTISSKDGDYKKTDKVELVLTPRDRREQETVIEFYNAANGNLTMLGELQLALKWCAILKDAIISTVSSKV